ncbi:hypothetical protein CYY_002938 [Polysphondylium violaceum]|uniref:Protein-tyrosine-phosphatase n=1 Tax=Polysphondylium violaceum TaxID=133409 RepID=A0A8J4PXR3_9MYCE|nr:hypothetical protein CYY_002938 [Polysphondylium violaceum]
MSEEDESECCGYWGMADEIVEEFDAQEVVPNLYIGSISAAKCTHQLKTKRINHVLSISTNPPSLDQKDFNCLAIEIEDEEKKDISSYFQQCHQFIEHGRKLGGILIHCQAGVSRSATVVISYLMNIFFKPFWDCFHYLQKIRPCIQPNRGFISQLLSYENQVLQKRNSGNNTNNSNNSDNSKSNNNNTE